MYLPRPTEWAGGSKSDIVYAASVSSTILPPILIEVQHTVTTEFIDRLINYSLSVKKCFKAKPILVVFGTHVTRTEISLDFEPTAFEFAKEVPVNIGLKSVISWTRTPSRKPPKQLPYQQW